MKNSDELLALAKQLQQILLQHSASYPQLQARILRMSLDYLKEGWAMQRDREQKEERDAKRELERLEALEADRSQSQQEQCDEFLKAQAKHFETFGQKGSPE